MYKALARLGIGCFVSEAIWLSTVLALSKQQQRTSKHLSPSPCGPLKCSSSISSINLRISASLKSLQIWAAYPIISASSLLAGFQDQRLRPTPYPRVNNASFAVSTSPSSRNCLAKKQFIFSLQKYG